MAAAALVYGDHQVSDVTRAALRRRRRSSTLAVGDRQSSAIHQLRSSAPALAASTTSNRHFGRKGFGAADAPVRHDDEAEAGRCGVTFDGRLPSIRQHFRAIRTHG